MYPLNQLKTLVSCGRDPARSLPLRRGFLLIPLILVCFALSPQMQAVSPPPDGGYPGFTTAEGQNALKSLTTAAGNTGLGAFSLFADSTGAFNTAVGAGALALNNADSNTAVGAVALLLNTTGTDNTAVGTDALVHNGDGSFNNAFGSQALFSHVGANANKTGNFNNAFGRAALFNNIHGEGNNAFGDEALFSDVEGSENTAFGDVALLSNLGNPATGEGDGNTAVGGAALVSNTTGSSNNAVGLDALGANTTGLANNAMGVDALADNDSGSGNTAVGDGVGLGNTSGSFNTYLGVNTTAIPDGESDTVRIGDPAFGVACFVGGIFGQTATGGVPVVVNANGQLGTVPAGSPLSMNELLKQQHLVQELKATTERQAAVIALQEGQIKTLTAGLKQQADQIQKVSAQLEMIRPTPRVVENR
jgi:trimeric autotransporter adhesin